MIVQHSPVIRMIIHNQEAGGFPRTPIIVR